MNATAASPEATVQLGCRGDVDLNRDFPDPLLLGNSSSALAGGGHEQPETRALIQWGSTTHFVASASLHEVCIPVVIHFIDVILSAIQAAERGSTTRR